MTDGGGVRSFRSCLLTQSICIISDGFRQDTDSNRIRIKCFCTCSDSGILIPERLRSKSYSRRVLRFLTGFHSGVVVNRRVVVIRNAYIRRGSVRHLFTDVGSSADSRPVPCGAVRRCFRSEYGRMIAFRFCLRTDRESHFAQRFRLTTVCGGVIGSRFRQYADCQRIIAFRLGTIRHGNSSRSLRFRCLSDSYAPAADCFRFRTDSDITGSCCTSLFADSNGLISGRTVILPVRSVRICAVIRFDREIMGNARITGEVNLAPVDTVFDSRAVSRDGEAFIRFFYVKGDGLSVFDFSFRCRCFITRCFQFPRAHDAVRTFGNTEVFFQLFHVQRVGDVSVRIDS